jgi:hypothetical protein
MTDICQFYHISTVQLDLHEQQKRNLVGKIHLIWYPELTFQNAQVSTDTE